MAVILKAVPNPVPFTHVQVDKKISKQLTLTWATGDPQVKVRVYRTLAGQAESLVADPANTLAATGTITDRLDYASVAVYRLRDAAKVQVGTPTTVTTVLSVPVPPPPPALPTQAIRQVRILARGDAVWLSFRTDLPTAPWVELVDPASSVMAAFWARPDLRTAHAMTFTGIGAPLEQGHAYAFRIVADKDRPADPFSNPSLTGTVQTGTRRAVVQFGGVDTGANGRLGRWWPGATLDLFAAAGDVDRWTVAGRRALGRWPAGSSEFIDESIVVDRAGREVWAWLAAQARFGSTIGTLFYTDLAVEPLQVPLPGTAGYDSDHESIGEVCAQYPTQPTLGAGPDWSPVVPVEESHPHDLTNTAYPQTYGATVVVRTTVTDGRWSFTGFTDEQMRRYRFEQLTGDTLRSTRCSPARFGAALGARSARVNPFGDVVVDVDGVTRLVPGPVQAVAGLAHPDGGVRLFGLRGDGDLIAADVAGADVPVHWRELGIGDVREVTVAQSNDGPLVLAVTTADELQCAQIDTGADPQWRRLATGARSAALVEGGSGGPLGAVVVGTDGAVCLVGLNPARAPHMEAVPLGTVPPGSVTASRHPDGSVSVLVVSDADGEAHLLGWPDPLAPPPDPTWSSLGPLAAVHAGAVDGPIDDALGAAATTSAE